MKNRTQLLFPILLTLVALASACSAPAESSNSSNVSNANAAQQTPIPQSGTPSATSDSGVPVTSVQATAKPTPEPDNGQGRAAAASPATAKAEPAQPASGPKIVVPVQKINFGLQAKDKTLVRTITVRNGGKSDLKIDAVEPS